MRSDRQRLLLDMYAAMSARLGPSGWWPGETPLEVAIGAVLTQNTAWGNVEKAIANLRDAGLLSDVGALLAASPQLVEACIRPSGYFRMKTTRLRDLMLFFDEACAGDLDALSASAGEDGDALRERLLSVKGIGPETADSILLYAFGHPSFVVDAYTCRILSRHGLLPEDVHYDEMRDFFMDVLDPDPVLYNEFHALIVRVAKGWCHKSRPDCAACPLGPFMEGCAC